MKGPFANLSLSEPQCPHPGNRSSKAAAHNADKAGGLEHRPGPHSFAGGGS